ncbi:MAG: hypothetical protein NDJ90_13230 [Oligoflexia bacterium]|nr:hypothetical protein [Oligoflexia bacterium]
MHLFAILCALAGALHVIAPDHWVPASLLSWQRRWRLSRIAGFAALAFGLHVALGFLLFYLFGEAVWEMASSNLLVFSLILVAGVAAIRAFRFQRIREVLASGGSGIWGVFMVFSLLGPCESLIPILIKSRQLGAGLLLPLVAFYAGTLLAGGALIFFGKGLWNRPHWLPRGLYAGTQRLATVPVIACVAVGLALLLKVS